MVTIEWSNWYKLLGKRILVQRNYFGTILERKVNELSPSGKYVKLGIEWYKIEDYKLIEILNDEMII